MKCPSCGEKLDDSARICPECGRDLTAAPVEAAPVTVLEAVPPVSVPERPQTVKKTAQRPRKRKILFRTLLLALLATALLAVSAMVYVRARDAARYPKQAAGSVLLTGDTTRVIYDDQAHVLYLSDSAPAAFFRSSMDGSRYLLVTTHPTGNTAIDLVKDGRLIRVTDSAAEDDVAFAADADALLWYSDYDGDAELGTLRLYRDGANAAFAERAAYPCLSPDGHTAAYCKADADGTLRMYLETDGADAGVALANARPVAVANGAKYLYYLQTDARTGALKLCVRTGGADTDLGALDTASVRYYANSDLSELLYYADGKTFVSINGAEGKKIANVLLFPMLPQETERTSHSAPAGTFSRLGTATLADAIYRGTNLLYYVDKSFAGTRISSDMTAASLSADGRTLAYLANGALYLTRSGTDARQKSAAIAEGNVVSFAMSDDGTSLAYILSGGALCRTDDAGKNIVSIADGAAAAAFAPGTDTLYWISDLQEKRGTLMTVDEAGEHAVDHGESAFAFCRTRADLLVRTDSVNGAYALYALRAGEMTFVAPGVKNMQYEP